MLLCNIIHLYFSLSLLSECCSQLVDKLAIHRPIRWHSPSLSPCWPCCRLCWVPCMPCTRPRLPRRDMLCQAKAICISNGQRSRNNEGRRKQKQGAPKKTTTTTTATEELKTQLSHGQGGGRGGG